MTRRMQDPEYDPEEIEEDDPLGEAGFDAAGFEDAPGGGPAFSAPGLEEDVDRRPGGGGQKVAGIPEARQHEVNTPSDERPDTSFGIIKERGGEGKGDPAVGGTRPD